MTMRSDETIKRKLSFISNEMQYVRSLLKDMSVECKNAVWHLDNALIAVREIEAELNNQQRFAARDTW